VNAVLSTHAKRAAGRKPAGLHRRGRSDGFTIVETLVAGMILALAGLAIATAVNQSMEALRRAKQTRQAARLLDRAMIRVDALGPATLLSQGPTQGRFSAPNNHFRWRVDIQSMVETDLYAVTVTVSWQAGASQRSVQASTRLNDAPGSRDSGLTMNDL